MKNQKEEINPKIEKQQNINNDEALSPQEIKRLRLEKKRQRKSVKIINRQVKIMGALFIAGFVAMAFYLGYYIQTQSSTAINNNYNKRSNILEENIHKGNILSASGDILAQTIDNEDGTYYRNYPYKNVFCHVVGSYDMGKTGLELSENYTMLGYDETIAKVLKSDLSGDKIQGNSIVTTLDTKLQQLCYDALGEHNGAVVVSEPSTGKILAMVSKPDYDPNEIKSKWDEINSSESSGSKLLNRATQGLYAPGSTFKIVTTLEYLRENNLNYSDYSYTCKGKDTFGSASISCYNQHVHGKVNLADSLAHSCNSSYANIGVGLSPTSFVKTVDGLMFNENLNFKDLLTSKSSFNLKEDANEEDKVQSAIGQGTTLLTPLENLMIVSSIANNGKLMTPYLVDKVITDSQKVVSQTEPSVCKEFMSGEEADILTQLMKGVCDYGTADELKQYECAGKTGSAEFSSEDASHAWFVGFAPADNPKVAVSIIVEGAGTGSKYAVPIADKIFGYYLRK